MMVHTMEAETVRKLGRLWDDELAWKLAAEMVQELVLDWVEESDPGLDIYWAEQMDLQTGKRLVPKSVQLSVSE